MSANRTVTAVFAVGGARDKPAGCKECKSPAVKT